MVNLLADQHQLILSVAGPVAVVDREALSGQMEHMTPLTLVEPEDAFGSEDFRRHLVVKKILELSQRKGPITLKGQRCVALDGELIRVLPVVVVVMMVLMAVVAVAMVVMVVAAMACLLYTSPSPRD